jgi:hypothetical protein
METPNVCTKSIIETCAVEQNEEGMTVYMELVLTEI